MNGPLATLFSPLSKSEFLMSYLGNSPVFTNNPQFLLDLKASKFLSSIESLFKKWPSDVNAYKQGLSDEVNSKKVSSEKAKKLFFDRGAGLFFDEPNRFCPHINQYLQELLQDLGLSKLTYSRSLLYALPKGKGTSTHFDQNINIIVQIEGLKKWWIAPNTTVQNPLDRHTLGHPLDPELASYTKESMPEHIPNEGLQEFTLKPGSILFLPRGAWHKTEALSDSLSLNFTYSAPTWIDIFTAALRGRLSQSSDWRETADLVSDPELYTHALEKFDHLLKNLSEDASDWRAYDILKATESSVQTDL